MRGCYWAKKSVKVLRNLFFHRLDGFRTIHDAVAFWPLCCLPEIILADALEVIAVALFDAVLEKAGGIGEEGVEPSHGLVNFEIEDQGKVRPDVIDGGFGDFKDLLEVHAAAAALVAPAWRKRSGRRGRIPRRRGPV